MQHNIKLVIKKDGTIESRVQGIQGPNCSVVSSWLDNLGVVTLDEPTDDFYIEEDINEEIEA